MTTITPPFTGSYAISLQGINVSSFDLFGMSVAPKLGRSGIKTFLSSSTTIIDVSPSARAFFDDSIRLPKQIKSIMALSSSIVEVISDDIFKVQQFPDYMLSRQTFGLETTELLSPFVELDKYDAVDYIESQTSYLAPVIIDSPSTIDIAEFSGVIEPFALRKVIAATSTFLGTFDNPEPTGVRGSLDSGVTQTDRKTKTVKSDNFYDIRSNVSNYFEEIGPRPEEELFTAPSFSLELPVESVDVSRVIPFTDITSIGESYNNITSVEIKNILISSSLRSDLPNGFPGLKFKSMPCGFEYDNSRGVDSITYGGQIK
ncbi:MAG: hypothetical protein H8E12_20330 [Rhodobacteraceae bacterium]|nr:hypothetical protein [Paracoccaceae bacterium]